MYVAGQGVPQDDAEAVKWFHKAAEQGEPVAQYNLGVLYYEGRGVTQNDVEALKWYRESAEQGYPLAQNNLGAHVREIRKKLRKKPKPNDHKDFSKDAQAFGVAMRMCDTLASRRRVCFGEAQSLVNALDA